jgi:hypothetical protein
VTFFAGEPFLIVILRKRGLRGAQAADEGPMYLGCKSRASPVLPGDTAECIDPSSESCAPRRTRCLRMTVQKSHKLQAGFISEESASGKTADSSRDTAAFGMTILSECLYRTVMLINMHPTV